MSGLTASYRRHSFGEGGPRNGGWGPAVRRSIAAAGSCFLRSQARGVILSCFSAVRFGSRVRSTRLEEGDLLKKSSRPVFCMSEVGFCLQVFVSEFVAKSLSGNFPTKGILFPTGMISGGVLFPDRYDSFGEIPDVCDKNRQVE